MTALRRSITTRAPSAEAIEMLIEDATIADVALTATAGLDAVAGDWGRYRSLDAVVETDTYHRLDGLAAMDFGLILTPASGMLTLVTVTVTAVEIAGAVRILSVDRARPLGAFGTRAPLGSKDNPVVVSEAPVPPVDAATRSIGWGTVRPIDETRRPAAPVMTDGIAAGIEADRLFDRRGRADRLRGEGMVLMQDAGGSAHDPELFARTIEGFNKDTIYAHTSDAVDANVEAWSDMRSARLIAKPGTHQIKGSAITMEAVLDIVEADGTEVSEAVLVMIDDVMNRLSWPIIEMHARGIDLIEERRFDALLRGIDLAVAREISDVSVMRLAHDWDEVDEVVIVPEPGTYKRTGQGESALGVSMLVVASFVFTDGSRTQGHLTYSMDNPDSGLLTGRLHGTPVRTVRMTDGHPY